MDYEHFPDGTPIEDWFRNTTIPPRETLGRAYCLTDYGIHDDGALHTAEIQALIDRIAAEGGGVLTVPAGTFRTGALFFRPGVHLYIAESGVLLGSDNIVDYPLLDTRIEGESCPYFAALINADGCDGFTMCGPGTIDGNGLRFWKAFWLRRAWNPACTNKDEQRPRLIYVSNSRNVLLGGLHLQNAAFWTNHFYRCQYVKILGCTIFSPEQPVRAPSTDAIDLDACTDVLIHGCTMHVNDDAVALKGGKGPWADTLPENGANERILIEHCHYGFCHGCLTLGSEAIHCRNVILRNCHAERADRVLWLKMRTDTPQHYEHIRVEGISGQCGSLLFIRPWTQFHRQQARADMPRSRCNDVTFSRITVKSRIAWDVETSEKYLLERFSADGQPLTF